jgi:hypothetical protein
MTNKIRDQYSDLDVTRQRKYALRHPDKKREAERRWLQSEGGKRSRSETNRRYREKQQMSKAVEKTVDN